MCILTYLYVKILLKQKYDNWARPFLQCVFFVIVIVLIEDKIIYICAY